MGAFIVVFILISGYLFVYNSSYQRFTARREDGQRYYFRCGAFGMFFIVLGIVVSFILDQLNIPSYLLQLADLSVEQFLGPTYKMPIREYWGIKMTIGAGLAVPFAWLFALIENFFRDEEKTRDYIYENLSSDMERFLSLCGAETKTILITLSNQKIYVGFVTDVRLENSEIDYFTILPVLSGYRCKEKLTVNFTTNYYVHYENLLDDNGNPLNGEGASLEDFIELIPVSEIVHIGKFDIETYKQFCNPPLATAMSLASITWMEPDDRFHQDYLDGLNDSDNPYNVTFSDTE